MSFRKASTAVLAAIALCIAASVSEASSRRRELQTPSHAALLQNFCPSENDELSAWLHQEIEKVRWLSLEASEAVRKLAALAAQFLRVHERLGDSLVEGAEHDAKQI